MSHLRARLSRLRRGGTGSVLAELANGIAQVADHELRTSITEAAHLADPSFLADCFDDEYLTTTSIGIRSRTATVLARRSIPTLALYSTESAAAFERECTGSETTVQTWPGTSHWLHLEDADRCGDLVTAWAGIVGLDADVHAR